MIADAVTPGVFIAVSLLWLESTSVHGLIGNDGLVYRAGGAALLAGSDPWSSTVRGYTFASPPLTAIVFAPTGLIPEPIFRFGWVAVCVAAGVVIVRRLGLPAYWIAYPPLVFGIALGNPSIPGMASILGGAAIFGLALRPHLAFVASRRVLLIFVALSAAAIVLRPDFVTGLAEHADAYFRESGTPVNWWGSPLMVLPLASLALLRDRRLFGWLIVPAIAPAVGWYGFAMVMPARDRALALACAVPIPGLGSAAITIWALAQVWRKRGRTKTPGDPPEPMRRFQLRPQASSGPGAILGR